MSRGMKISRHVSFYYNSVAQFYGKIKEIVDGMLPGLIDQRWHYESRLKSLESFALKLETGRFEGFEKIDDFFAATIVVENTKAIASAKALLVSEFDFRLERPADSGRTHMKSSSFEFDDLRMYFSLKDNGLHVGLEEYVFEIQIKTYLQHAWAIATHDMVYKGDRVDWGLARIAYQVKAMLEHAEASIESAGGMSKACCLSRTDDRTMRCNECVDILKDFWSDEQLPRGVMRVAENVLMLLRIFDKDLNFLCCILNERYEKEGRVAFLSLSPYLATVQLLVDVCGCGPLNKTFKDKKLKVFVTPDVSFPDGVDVKALKNIVYVESAVEAAVDMGFEPPQLSTSYSAIMDYMARYDAGE